jgi:hypothetical protein
MPRNGYGASDEDLDLSWSWEQIERDWLGGGRIAVSSADAVNAFNRAEETLGADWITGCRGSSGTAMGLAPTLTVVTMGQFLAALNGASGADGLLQKLRRRDASADAELTAIYLLKRDQPNACVELEPEVTIGGRIGKPDFRIVLNVDDWTYVEVTQANLSAEQALAHRIIEEIAALIKPIKRNFAVNVFLRRIPTGDELKELEEYLPEFCVLGEATRRSLGDLGFLLLNHDEPGQATLPQHEGEENCHGICIMAAVSGPDEPHRHIVVQVALSDDRAQQFLESEAKQLPKHAPGLIMVQMSRAPGGFQTWEPILRQRLQPNLHTRVGGVCLFDSGFNPTAQGEAWIPRTKVISNPNATRPLPDWIGKQLIRFASDREF